jgi:hypothetical protein
MAPRVLVKKNNLDSSALRLLGDRPGTRLPLSNEGHQVLSDIETPCHAYLAVVKHPRYHTKTSVQTTRKNRTQTPTSKHQTTSRRGGQRLAKHLLDPQNIGLVYHTKIQNRMGNHHASS